MTALLFAGQLLALLTMVGARAFLQDESLIVATWDTELAGGSEQPAVDKTGEGARTHHPKDVRAVLPQHHETHHRQ